MLRAFAAALVGLAAVQAAQSVHVRDIDERSRSMLAPGPGRFEVVFFLSPDCPISNRYAPEIARICREYAPKGAHCFTIYPDVADAAVVRRHRDEFGFPASIPAILDRDHSVVRAVGARVTPEAALYSSAGRLYRGRIDHLYVDVGRSRREATRRDVRLALDAALSGRSISQPETEAVGCSIQQR